MTSRFLITACTLLLAFGLSADELERWLLPITPSTVHCGYQSKYVTSLVIHNSGSAMAEPVCFGFGCTPLLARQGRMIAGEDEVVPLPSYVYLPKEDAPEVAMKLVIESSHQGGEDRFFTDLPVVPESSFSDRVELLGVRTDADYRQTLRIYGRDVDAGKTVRVDIYDVETGELLLQPRHVLHVYPVPGNQPLSSAPSFTMECDLTAVSAMLRGRTLRLVITPEDDEAELWAFASITNNATQHFYTVLPDQTQPAGKER